MEIKEEVQFIICAKCSGEGKTKNGLKCPNCSGLGVGTFFKGYFLFWGLKLGRAVIKLRHLKMSVNFFVNLAAYIFGLVGLLALGWWVYQTTKFNQIEALLFWRTKDWLILTFWLSVFADMFVFYRISLSHNNQKKIKLEKYLPADHKKLNRQIPNNWGELKKYHYQTDVSSAVSDKVMNIIEDAFTLANKQRQPEVNIRHLFFSLLKDKEVAALFIRLNVDGVKLIRKLKNHLSDLEPNINLNSVKLASEVKEIIIEAYTEAYNLGQQKIKVLNLILPSLKRDKVLAEILYDLEVDQDKIKNIIAWFRINEKLIAKYRLSRKMAKYKPSSSMDRAYTAVATPVLNHFAYDLTAAVKWGKLGICVARDEEIKSIFETFESGRPGVILVGPVGVGKRTIINGIAELMVEENVPKFFRDKRLVELDIARLISGATPSQAEERLLVILDEVIKAGNIILYFEDIENLAGITAGEQESLELSEVLVNALNRNLIYVLATVTNKNYVEHIENIALGKAMAKIEILEPSGNQAIQIAESKVGYLESKNKVYFSYNAIEAAVNLSKKFIPGEYLPAKAIKILESTAVKVSKRCQSDSTKCICSQDDIATTITEITKIPVHKFTAEEGKKLQNLETYIHERMVNQEEAVKMVAASLRRSRAELREGKRPISSFLFLGPTGVGKTELAKTVAEVYFASEGNMIRVDMSEYQNQDSVNKMIGDNTGQLGYLTERVRTKPFSLILLDEFEKAHPDILNLFLQVMDDGRLTDGQGSTVDFTNSIIIATSNVGAVYIQEQIRANTDIEKIKDGLINEHLNKFLRPELINRFDGVVVFKPLSQVNVIEITKLMLKSTKKMLEVKGIGLRLEEEGIIKLAQAGYDPKFGARPLRRLLQEKVDNIIANKILAGELARRDTVMINSQADVQVEKGR
ncbi:MAG: ATP-dependent Clp protease ATP-binding subunit, partial [Patescibacteria group bacterium]